MLFDALFPLYHAAHRLCHPLIIGIRWLTSLFTAKERYCHRWAVLLASPLIGSMREFSISLKQFIARLMLFYRIFMGQTKFAVKLFSFGFPESLKINGKHPCIASKMKNFINYLKISHYFWLDWVRYLLTCVGIKGVPFSVVWRQSHIIPDV